MRHVPFIDSTGLHNLKDVIKDLHHSHTTVILSGVRPEILKELEKNKVLELLDQSMILSTFDLALQKANDFLN